MKWLYFVVLLLFVLTACTINSEAPTVTLTTNHASPIAPSPTAISPATVTQTLTHSLESPTYKITIDTPVSGDNVFVGVVNTFQGRIDPIPKKDKLSIYLEVKDGWHQHFDTVDIDPENGEWFYEEPIHPNYTGPAQLVVELVETVEEEPPYFYINQLAQQSVDVYLDYDPSDESVYVNLNQPKSENNIVQVGEILMLEGSSHNPIGNQIVVEIKDCTTQTMLHKELIATEGGHWQLAVLISPEFAKLEGNVCIFACTDDDDRLDAAWCGWRDIVIESQ